ncbi:MAG: DUF2849 domain-containing protein [Alphaproteobacteria bacterium]|nr:MAG: DUF2849 domain-containing protein [Alphaproteobacteria bacterium]
MARAQHPVILTAQDLIEGDAVWWTGTGWSRNLAHALVYNDPAAADAAEARLAAEESRVVGVYRVEVDPAPVPRPILRREAIRADGRPSFAYRPQGAARRAA